MTSARLALADLRDSWSAWLAVSLTFVTTSATLGLSFLGLHSALTARAAGHLGRDAAQILTVDAGVNATLCSLVALGVVSSSTSLVVASRRGAIARLLLAGAAPRQVVGMIVLQLAVAATLCSVVGSAIAVAVQPAALRALGRDRGFTAPDALVSPSVLLSASLCCAGLAVLGGLRQARRATAIPAVEALRSSVGAPSARTRGWVVVLRWLGCTVCFGTVAGSVVVFRASAADLGDDAMSAISQISFIALPLTGLGLALVAASLVGPLTRAWTRLLPVPGATWHLARHTVVARADRMSKSVVPVMFAVGLVFGMVALMDTMVATLRANGYDGELEGTSAATVLTTIGLPLAIAIAGSVGNLVMMSRQRDAELALDGIVGATPAQQRLLPALEATIVTGTAALLGLTMAAVSSGALAYGLRFAVPTSHVSLPIAPLLVVLGGTWVVTVLATVLPSLPALRRPAPRVIARLVAS